MSVELYRLKDGSTTSVHEFRFWQQAGFGMEQLERVTVRVFVEEAVTK
jgi:hypothetical protein